MSDLIRKRELYHKLAEAYQKGYFSWGANEIFKDIIGECDSVGNKGEWIIYGFPSSEQIKNCTEDYYCSECKFVVSRFESRACNFCPNCGADMRGEADEKT